LAIIQMSQFIIYQEHYNPILEATLGRRPSFSFLL
jgi:hypothetical protein